MMESLANQPGQLINHYILITFQWVTIMEQLFR